MSTTRRWMTADELFAMPDDGMRHELVRGELQSMTPAGGEHGAVVGNLTSLVGPAVRSNGLGTIFGAETGFLLATDPDTLRAPDLAFIRRERIPAGGIPKTYMTTVPDLVAEVISPSDRYADVEEKVLEWLAAGVEIVWVLNPRTRTVTVHSRSEGVNVLSATDELTGGAVLPGFSCPLSELFD
ncbi:Uma2 family endonuclease [soil metagenome]|nr:Uma2 family endonuclease [Gemmatimonadota bacterium]